MLMSSFDIAANGKVKLNIFLQSNNQKKFFKDASSCISKLLFSQIQFIKIQILYKPSKTWNLLICHFNQRFFIVYKKNP